MSRETEAAYERRRGSLNALILAAGLGTRMRSSKAKVLHQLAGRPLIAHPCITAASLEPEKLVIVVGYQAEEVEAAAREAINSEALRFVVQQQQRGTADAVRAAQNILGETHSTLLVLSGDVPLVRSETLAALVRYHQTSEAECTLLSVILESPTGYGRIIRQENGSFRRIVEEKDASPEEQIITEINAGIYCFETDSLFETLEQVKPVNAQSEYYLTDVPALLASTGAQVSVFLHDDAREVSGINNRLELSEFERLIRVSTLHRLMLESGVTLIDPDNVYVEPGVRIGRDTVLHPGVILGGSTVIGENCEIRSGSRIKNSTIGNGVLVKDYCVILDSDIGTGCEIGPFAHLRMNARLEDGAAIGDFVEVKKSSLGRGSKAMHLSYLGDATIGERVNIGAGTVTCNFDGVNKNRTIIDDEVKIGSDTMLVAPVRVHSRSVTGAGSVVTDDVPPSTLVAGVPAKIKKRLNKESES